MLYRCSVSRISKATKDILVEADGFAEARNKAVEEAGDTDFHGATTDYDYEVGDVTCEGEPEPEPTCCAFCGRPMPDDIERVVSDGWTPEFWSDGGSGGPACPECGDRFLEETEGGEVIVKLLQGLFVQKCHESNTMTRTGCVCNPFTHDLYFTEEMVDCGGPVDESYVCVAGVGRIEAVPAHLKTCSPPGAYSWGEFSMGEFVTEWESGKTFRSECVVHEFTREITFLADHEVDQGVGFLKDQYVEIHGQRYKVCPKSDLDAHSKEEQEKMFFYESINIVPLLNFN